MRGNITIAVITCLIAVTLGILSIFIGSKVDIGDMLESPKWYVYIILIGVGFLASVSLIIPGISGSMVLVVLGFYVPILNLITETLKNIGGAHFWTSVLEILCLAVGVIIGLLSVAKLMAHLLKHYKIKKKHSRCSYNNFFTAIYTIYVFIYKAYITAE